MVQMPLFISVMGSCLLRGVGTHGWVVRFCQPSVYSLHLEAGCQKWKLQDVSGTQPPLSDTVVNGIFNTCGLITFLGEFFVQYSEYYLEQLASRS